MPADMIKHALDDAQPERKFIRVDKKFKPIYAPEQTPPPTKQTPPPTKQTPPPTTKPTEYEYSQTALDEAAAAMGKAKVKGSATDPTVVANKYIKATGVDPGKYYPSLDYTRAYDSTGVPNHADGKMVLVQNLPDSGPVRKVDIGSYKPLPGMPGILSAPINKNESSVGGLMEMGFGDGYKDYLNRVRGGRSALSQADQDKMSALQPLDDGSLAAKTTMYKTKPGGISGGMYAGQASNLPRDVYGIYSKNPQAHVAINNTVELDPSNGALGDSPGGWSPYSVPQHELVHNLQRVRGIPNNDSALPSSLLPAYHAASREGKYEGTNPAEFAAEASAQKASLREWLRAAKQPEPTTPEGWMNVMRAYNKTMDSHGGNTRIDTRKYSPEEMRSKAQAYNLFAKNDRPGDINKAAAWKLKGDKQYWIDDATGQAAAPPASERGMVDEFTANGADNDAFNNKTNVRTMSLTRQQGGWRPEKSREGGVKGYDAGMRASYKTDASGGITGLSGRDLATAFTTTEPRMDQVRQANRGKPPPQMPVKPSGGVDVQAATAKAYKPGAFKAIPTRDIDFSQAKKPFQPAQAPKPSAPGGAVPRRGPVQSPAARPAQNQPVFTNGPASRVSAPGYKFKFQ
jgi:hypothetical protein